MLDIVTSKMAKAFQKQWSVTETQVKAASWPLFRPIPSLRQFGCRSPAELSSFVVVLSPNVAILGLESCYGYSQHGCNFIGGQCGPRGVRLD